MATKTIAVESVAEAYLTLLAERGIEYLFANGGTDFAPVNEALAAIRAKGTKPQLKVVTVPHENVATAMAHGYYLMTGRPQMVMFHVNVGTANGINALDRRGARPRADDLHRRAAIRSPSAASPARATPASIGARRCSTRPAWCASCASGTMSCGTARSSRR